MLRTDLSRFFSVVKVIKPEEGYDPKTDTYGVAWEPEVTLDPSEGGKSTGRPNNGLTAARKGEKVEKEVNRVDRLSQFYSAIAEGDEEAESPFDENGLRVDLPVFNGLRPLNPSIGGFVPQEKAVAHLGVAMGRVGMRTK